MADKKEKATMVRVNTRISKQINDWLDEQSAKTGVPKGTQIMIALEQYYFQKETYAQMDKFKKIMEQMKGIENKTDE